MQCRALGNIWERLHSKYKTHPWNSEYIFSTSLHMAYFTYWYKNCRFSVVLFSDPSFRLKLHVVHVFQLFLPLAIKAMQLEAAFPLFWRTTRQSCMSNYHFWFYLMTSLNQRHHCWGWGFPSLVRDGWSQQKRDPPPHTHTWGLAIFFWPLYHIGCYSQRDVFQLPLFSQGTCSILAVCVGFLNGIQNNFHCSSVLHCI